MAFNLNKNEATNSSTKFDLSKSSSSSGVNTEEGKSKSNIWLFTLLGLLVIGITAWYFLSRSNDNSKNENEVVSSVVTDSNSASSPADNQNKTAADPVNTTGHVKTENQNAANTSAKIDNANAKTDNNTNTSTATNISGTSIKNRVTATFAKGSNSISALDESVVKDIIAFLEKNPGLVITVNGYASSEGTLAVNQTISQSRADAFKRHLLSKGIPSNRVNATGKGIENPISSNDTEEGRIKNRRVQISLQ